MKNHNVAMAFNESLTEGINTLNLAYIPQSDGGDHPKRLKSYSTVVAMGQYKSYDSMSITTAHHLSRVVAIPLWGAFSRGIWNQPNTYEDLAVNIARSFKNHQSALNMNRAKDREQYRAMLRAYHFMRMHNRVCDDATKVMETYVKLYDAWKEKHTNRAQREEDLFNR